MDVQGIVFAGTGTAARQEMTRFVHEVLGLARTEVAGVEADLFDLPDGSSFAVASAQGMGATARSLGFLVSDIDAAVRELRAAGAPWTRRSRATRASATSTSAHRTGSSTSWSRGVLAPPPPERRALVAERSTTGGQKVDSVP
jgi:glyoxylase I family protein